MPKTYEPDGTSFFDEATQRKMLLVADDSPSPWAGWLCYRNPNGHWVSLRKASDEDRARIAAAQDAALGLIT
jgi:hypothetical protein